MGDKLNFAALDWVIGEISETLNDARSALEAFVEDPKDSTKMRFCLTHIHQVYGSLQMVEFHGASLLAEEMEHLAQALINNNVSSGPEAHEVLMRSMLQLPIYLERVKNEKEDNPAAILPLLNDLRAVRKQSYLSETNLFSPDLSSLGAIQGQKHQITHDPEKLKEVLKKLREMYQFSAASVLRDIKTRENLEYIEKVFGRLQLITSGTANNPLWEAASAMIEGLREDNIQLSVAVRGLLRYLARELRILGEKAPGALDMRPPESLLKNLLYYVARAKGSSKKILNVKARYNLGKALIGGVDASADKGGMAVPDPDAIRSVVVALQDEINTIKHILDLSLTGQSAPTELKEVLPVIKRVADTLAVLGIGDLRKQVLMQAEVLEDLSNQNDLDGYQLMEVANKVIEFENRLSAIAKAAGRHQDLDSLDERAVEIDQAKRTVLKECQRGLEQAKDAIVEYISSQWNKSHLENIDSLLTDIRGGLDMVPLARPGKILDACNAYIRENLMVGDDHPEWSSLDALADAIASVEYYLERLIEDLDEDLEPLLDVAEESVSALGYAVATTPASVSNIQEPADTSLTQESPAYSSSPEVSTEVVQENIDIPLPETSDDFVQAGQNVEVEPSTYEEPVEAITAEFNDPQAQEEVVEPAAELPQETVQQEAVAEDKPAAPQKPAPIISLDKISVDDDEDESDIDDEIIEIFIEEAGEVSETLEEYFPKWRADQHDNDSLVVVRRAFHTLKGSGRMVEANDIGELAWSVENMLNRVIDRTVSAQPAHSHLIMLVLNVLPQLISAFENRQSNPLPELTEQYMAWGNALSEGNVPAELEDEPVLPEFAAPSAEANEAEQPDVAVPTPVVEALDESEEENEDHVLWDIFSSEAETHLEVMQDFIEQMEDAAPIYSPPSDDLQRAMHTLKGSAKMAQIKAIADLVEPLETFAKELISYQVPINADILQLLKDAVDYTREGLGHIEARQEVHISKLEQFLARSAELRELSVGHLIRLHELEKQGNNQVDPQLLSIFMAEEMKMLLDADKLLATWEQQGIEAVDLHGLIKELSLLEVGAEKAKLPEMAELAKALRETHEKAQASALVTDNAFFNLLGRGHESLLDLVDAVAAGQNIMAPPEDIVPSLQALPLAEPAIESTAVEFDAPVEQQAEEDEFAAIQNEDFVLEDAANETLELGEPSFQGELQDELIDEEEPASFESEDLTLIDEENIDENASLTLSDFASDQDSHQSLESVGFEPTEALIPEPSENSINVSENITDESSDEENITEFAHTDSSEEDEVPGAEAYSNTEDPQFVEPVLEEHIEVSQEEPDSSLEQSEQVGVDEPHDSTQTAAVATTGLLDTIDVNDEDFDEDILEVFLEEAEELIEELDEAVHAWENDWSNVDSVEAIKRALHTLKGGARLAGMNNLGELTHEYESYLIGVDISDVDGAFFNRIHSYQDRVLSGVRAIQAFMGSGAEIATADDSLTAEPQQAPDTIEYAPVDTPSDDVASEAQADEAPATETPASESKANVLPFAAKPKESDAAAPVETGNDGGGGFVMPTVSGNQATAQVAARKAGPQEVVKVSAELLEELVNLAGETSISRGRLEQQVSDFGVAIDEIDGTIERLQEQLRRLDIETQAQILFRQEQIEEAQKDFDPLEMDRYSALQQLSRSLIESASDLMDLKATLSDKVRDTETLLLQQARVNSTLQEGLMRSRMVPFSRLVPRLRRIVRQVAAELGKQVSFELDNVEGELDRSVLERMVAPLEHMLRNAVDHGIETPNDRIAAGKSESGRIVLTLGREGGDVILRLADDGRGIDLKRVREKAIERGLMSADAQLSDHDIMQFILHAGFSTAENVTQISGRGVGMDVVYAEIKQLGGSVSINSSWGKGTEFFVRLPFTVSVNRALMVEMSGDHYAVPLNSIEGIVRVSPFELEHYYSDPEARFEYAGERYEVRYLGTMLDASSRPRLEGKSLPIPVLLVRSAEHTMALQVDGLMGSREIVVKSLGQQFSTVQGLSGATVMGDGSVVIILDPHALVRKEMALLSAQHTLLEASDEDIQSADSAKEVKITTVMVVDDSVTVRKVTTRFLEREGFEVITAKDGVHALEVLQDTIPDLMLLDIEMPRMDGFEVAKNVRTTSRWKNIPIIMITSRTGDKHREHALSLGVNKYLGKPYQEDVLLESINELLAESKNA